MSLSAPLLTGTSVSNSTQENRQALGASSTERGAISRVAEEALESSDWSMASDECRRLTNVTDLNRSLGTYGAWKTLDWVESHDCSMLSIEPEYAEAILAHILGVEQIKKVEIAEVTANLETLKKWVETENFTPWSWPLFPGDGRNLIQAVDQEQRWQYKQKATEAKKRGDTLFQLYSRQIRRGLTTPYSDLVSASELMAITTDTDTSRKVKEWLRLEVTRGFSDWSAFLNWLSPAVQEVGLDERKRELEVGNLAHEFCATRNLEILSLLSVADIERLPDLFALLSRSGAKAVMEWLRNRSGLTPDKQIDYLLEKFGNAIADYLPHIKPESVEALSYESRRNLVAVSKENDFSLFATLLIKEGVTVDFFTEDEKRLFFSHFEVVENGRVHLQKSGLLFIEWFRKYEAMIGKDNGPLLSLLVGILLIHLSKRPSVPFDTKGASIDPIGEPVNSVDKESL